MFKLTNHIDNKLFANTTPTNVRVTPVVIKPPKVNPQRDDKVTLL